MKRDAIDLSTLNVFTLFRKYFVPTLLGMLSMSVSDLLAFITACLMLAHHIKKLNKITEV